MPKATYRIAKGGITRSENGVTKRYSAGDIIEMDTETAKKEIFASRLVPVSGVQVQQQESASRTPVLRDLYDDQTAASDSQSAAETLDASPLEVIDTVRKMTDADRLQDLKTEEQNGKKRKSVLNAIDSRIQDLNQ